MAIKNVLIRCSLPLSKCQGQDYDGASVMMGHLTGVATVTERGNKSPSSSLFGSLLKLVSSGYC